MDHLPENEIDRIEREMTEEQIFDLLTIHTSAKVKQQLLTLKDRSLDVKDMAYSFKFVATEDNIYVDTEDESHRMIALDNGVSIRSCLIDNGLVIKVSYVRFAYHGDEKRSKFRKASERKIMGLLKENGVV